MLRVFIAFVFLGMEKTYEVSQREIVEAVDIQSAVKSFSLSLTEVVSFPSFKICFAVPHKTYSSFQLGPYSTAYSRNGRNLLLGGRKGCPSLFFNSPPDTPFHSAFPNSSFPQVIWRYWTGVMPRCFVNVCSLWSEKYVFLCPMEGEALVVNLSLSLLSVSFRCLSFFLSLSLSCPFQCRWERRWGMWCSFTTTPCGLPHKRNTFTSTTKEVRKQTDSFSSSFLFVLFKSHPILILFSPLIRIFLNISEGVELHRLKKHINPNRLQFLPYHFLLVSVGMSGMIVWAKFTVVFILSPSLISNFRVSDIPGHVYRQPGVQSQHSLGEVQHLFSLPLVLHSLNSLWLDQSFSCDCMEQNPSNAVIHLGHSSGQVTLWTPNFTEPVVKMFCHKGTAFWCSHSLTDSIARSCVIDRDWSLRTPHGDVGVGWAHEDLGFAHIQNVVWLLHSRSRCFHALQSEYDLSPSLCSLWRFSMRRS